MSDGFDLKQVCQRLNATLLISTISPISENFKFYRLNRLDQAKCDELSLCIDPAYLKKEILCQTQALVVLCSSALVQSIQEINPSLNLIVVEDGRSAFYELMKYISVYPPKSIPPSIHPTTVFLGEVIVDPTVSIGPYCVIAAGVCLGAFVRLEAFVYVGARAKIGASSEIESHVYIGEDTIIGKNTTIGSGAVIGSQGFGLDLQGKRVKHLGNVEIGDDCYISALSAVNRATLGSTKIGNAVQIDHLVQVGHNVELEDQVVLCAQVGIAGGAKIGKGSILGGQVGVNNRVEIGAFAKIAAKSGVTKDLKGNQSYAGYPAEENQEYLRRLANVKRFFQSKRSK